MYYKIKSRMAAGKKKIIFQNLANIKRMAYF